MQAYAAAGGYPAYRRAGLAPRRPNVPALVGARAALTATALSAISIADFNGQLTEKASTGLEQFIPEANHLRLPSDIGRVVPNGAPVGPGPWDDEHGNTHTDMELASFMYMNEKNLHVYPADFGKLDSLHLPNRIGNLRAAYAVGVGTDTGALEPGAAPIQGRATLTPMLHLSTMIHIAALNLGCVDDEPQLAFARAVGVSLGLLPTTGTIEYKLTDEVPPDAAYAAIEAYTEQDPRMCVAQALHWLAGYGIIHARMGHTYRGGADLKQWYVDRMKTLMTGCQLEITWVDDTRNAAACRTAAHPFGDVNTFELALAMSEAQVLETNFRKRLPPMFHELYTFVIAEEAISIFRSQTWFRFFRHAQSENIRIVEDFLRDARVGTAYLRYTDRSKAYTGLAKQTPTGAQEAAAEAIVAYFAGYASVYYEGSAWTNSYALTRVMEKHRSIAINFMNILQKQVEVASAAGYARFFGISDTVEKQLVTGVLAPGGVPLLPAPAIAAAPAGPPGGP